MFYSAKRFLLKKINKYNPESTYTVSLDSGDVVDKITVDRENTTYEQLKNRIKSELLGGIDFTKNELKIGFGGQHLGYLQPVFVIEPKLRYDSQGKRVYYFGSEPVAYPEQSLDDVSAFRGDTPLFVKVTPLDTSDEAKYLCRLEDHWTDYCSGNSKTSFTSDDMDTALKMKSIHGVRFLIQRGYKLTEAQIPIHRKFILESYSEQASL